MHDLYLIRCRSLFNNQVNQEKLKTFLPYPYDQEVIHLQVQNLFERVQPRLVEYHRNTNDLEFISEFVGAVPTSIMDWINNKQPCKGARLIRLWHFLDAAGFESPELEKIPPFNCYLGQLFAFGVITMDEVLQYAGVRNEQTGFQMMRGQPPMHPAMSLEDVQELHDEQLEQVLTAFGRRLRKFDEPSTVRQAATPEAPEVPAVQVPTGPMDATSGTVYTLATLFGAALPLARHLNSDRCKPQDRALLRELMGEDGIFELSNILNALCGERARSQSRS